MKEFVVFCVKTDIVLTRKCMHINNILVFVLLLGKVIQKTGPLLF